MNKIEYLLTCISEEAGEVSQMVGKCQRFGLNSLKSTTDPRYRTNIEELRKEVHDAIGSYRLLCEEIGMDSTIDESLVKTKIDRINFFMNSSIKHGHLILE